MGHLPYINCLGVHIFYSMQFARVITDKSKRFVIFLSSLSNLSEIDIIYIDPGCEKTCLRTF